MNPSSRRVAWSFLSLLVATTACSGVVRTDVNADAGAGGGGARASDGGVTAHPGPGVTDASSVLAPESGHEQRSCQELTASAQRLYDAIDPDLTCTADADCMAEPRPPCVPGCGFAAVSVAGASMLQSAVDAASADCDAFSKQTCPVEALPCVIQIGQPACVKGQCTNFIPLVWPSMTLVESNVPYRLECETSDHCTSYTVVPSGNVFSNSPAGGKAFDAADLAAINAIADDLDFRQGFITGFGCAASTSKTYITLSREYTNGAKTSQDVTGCIFAGPPNNQPLALWNLFQSLGAASDGGTTITDAAVTD